MEESLYEFNVRQTASVLLCISFALCVFLYIQTTEVLAVYTFTAVDMLFHKTSVMHQKRRESCDGCVALRAKGK